MLSDPAVKVERCKSFRIFIVSAEALRAGVIMNFGVIFDWDGVIIDSSDFHEASWERLAEHEGKELPPGYFKKGFGMRNETIIPEILQWTNDPQEVQRLADLKEQFYRAVMIRQGISPLPGVRPLLKSLRDHGIKCAVGSSTPLLNITTALNLLGLRDSFDAIVAAEDVTRGKPDPQVFLVAAQKIGMPPYRCVVFEDALAGIDAGRKAGMKVVAVATTNPPDRLTLAHRIVQRLDEISVDALERLFD